MTTNHHTPIAAGESNAVATINSRLSDLDAAITGGSGQFFGGNVATLTQGAADAGQTTIVVDSTTGFVAGARVAYILIGGTLEYNVIALVEDAATLTVVTNIGAGGIADNTYIALISEGEYQASVAIEYGNGVVPTLATAMEWSSEGIFNVRAYGAKGDAVTDDTVAINAAMTAARAAGSAAQVGGKVVFPPGKYMVSETIEIPTRVIAEGTGFGGAQIMALSTMDFDIWPALIHLGSAATSGTQTLAACHLRNINVDCNNRPRSIAIRMDSAQEGSGLWNVRARGWTSMGIQVNEFSAFPNAKQWSFQDIDLTAGADIRTHTKSLSNITGDGTTVTVTAAAHLFKKGDLVGITDTSNHNNTYIVSAVPNANTIEFLSTITNTETSGTLTQESCGIMWRQTGSGGSRIDRCTVTTAASVWNTANKQLYAGILMGNVEGSTLSQLHLERGYHGLLIGERFTCQGIVVQGIGCSGNATTNKTENLVTIKGASKHIVIMGASKEVATNVINNLNTNIQYTDTHVSTFVIAGTNTSYVHTVGGEAYWASSGSPISSITPNNIGERYFNTALTEWWISTGVTNTSWKRLARKKDFVQVRREAAVQTITNNLFQFVTWDTLKYESNTVMWTDTSGTNPDRVRPVTGSRWYMITAYVEWAANATGVRKMRLMRELGGGPTDVSWSTTPAASGGSVTGQHLTYYMTQVGSSGYFWISVLQDSGGDLDIEDAFMQIEEILLD